MMDRHWAEDMDWPMRTINAVRFDNISRDDAMRMTDAEWLRVPNLGKLGLAAIRLDFPSPVIEETPHNAYARGWRDAMHAVSQAIGSVFIPPVKP